MHWRGANTYEEWSALPLPESPVWNTWKRLTTRLMIITGCFTGHAQKPPWRMSVPLHQQYGHYIWKLNKHVAEEPKTTQTTFISPRVSNLEQDQKNPSMGTTRIPGPMQSPLIRLHCRVHPPGDDCSGIQGLWCKGAGLYIAHSFILYILYNIESLSKEK